MISKSKAITITILFLLLIWIVQGPQIVSQFKKDGELSLYETQYIDYSNNGTVTYAIDTIDYNPADYREVITLKGWGFIDLNRNISQREINILFLSEKRSYKAETRISKRHEIAEIYKPGNTAGINDELGFDTMFSAITIKNGEYKIAVALRENDTEKVEYTGKILKKEAGRISIIDDNETGRSNFTEFIDSLSNLPEAYGSVDVISNVGAGNVYIYGWVFGELTQQINTRNIYAILSSAENAYSAPLQIISRYGLINALNQNVSADSLLSPAYKGILAFDIVKDGEYRLLLLVSENNADYLHNPGVSVKKQGNAISIMKE